MFLVAQILAAHGVEPATFSPGDVYYGGANSEIVRVVEGDTHPILVQLDTYSAGQIAFSPDLTTLYFTVYNPGQVVAVEPDGTFTTVATGLDTPTGLLVTQQGRMLVSSFKAGQILDVTKGGDQTYTKPLTTGLKGPRSLVQLPTGEVLVADQILDGVYDVGYPDGGVAELFAEVELVRHLAHDGKVLYAVSEGFVFDITAGGIFQPREALSFGQPFFSLTVDGKGRLLSGELTGTVLWDVTAGGDFDEATPFATGLPLGETLLATVPQAVPEPPLETGDTADTSDTGEAPTEPTPTDDTGTPSTDGTVVLDGEGDGGCGCQQPGGSAGWLALALAALAPLRRRR
ncbi:MAG: GlyGly-CTERM sorting domain-containing protein [Myxococcales bacterium]|nr:GlyGly-CTERM sorting domain-containing protein [Myxococcales bacterium]